MHKLGKQLTLWLMIAIIQWQPIQLSSLQQQDHSFSTAVQQVTAHHQVESQASQPHNCHAAHSMLLVNTFHPAILCFSSHAYPALTEQTLAALILPDTPPPKYSV